jgi:gamma-carbonic anhydrase
MILRSFNGKTPQIHPDAWIAENAVLIGDVEIKAFANIWYNVVIRGDLNSIVIGENTNIQDGSIIHVESDDGPCIIGDNVTVGHNAIVHGCVVGNRSLIGMGATVLSWANIGDDSIVGAGALVKEHDIIGDRKMAVGVPAKVRADVSDDMIERMKDGVDHYLDLAASYKKEELK